MTYEAEYTKALLDIETWSCDPRGDGSVMPVVMDSIQSMPMVSEEPGRRATNHRPVELFGAWRAVR